MSSGHFALCMFGDFIEKLARHQNQVDVAQVHLIMATNSLVAEPPRLIRSFCDICPALLAR
jgi:hypothetical protein